MVRKGQELRPVMTRIPEGLRRRLEREAEQNRRSMNAEIIHRLEQSFQRQDQKEMINAAVKSSAGAAVVKALYELHILPQQSHGKPEVSNEQLARPSADKEEKSE
jgi:Arc-like DNA binding domain